MPGRSVLRRLSSRGNIATVQGTRSQVASQVSEPQHNSALLLAIQSADVSRIPHSMTFQQGALVEPLSVVMNGLILAPITLGTGAVICGAGPIGLIALVAARASGAHPIVISDIEPKRLEFAKQLVPSCQPYQVCAKKSPQEMAAEIQALFGSHPSTAPRTILECSGVESSIRTAIYTVRTAGTVVVIGVGKTNMNELPLIHLMTQQVATLPSTFIPSYH